MIEHAAWPDLSVGDTVIVGHRHDGWSRVVTITELLPPLPGAGEGFITTTGKAYQHFSFEVTPTDQHDVARIDATFDQLTLDLALELNNQATP